MSYRLMRLLLRLLVVAIAAEQYQPVQLGVLIDLSSSKASYL